MKKIRGLQAIEKPLASLPYAIGKHILDHIQKTHSLRTSHRDHGQNRCGKSSLCNALFQVKLRPSVMLTPAPVTYCDSD